MTLPSSFPISASQINVELGRASNAAFDLQGTNERALAGIPSGAISFSDFLGKAWQSITQTDSRLTADSGTSTRTFNSCALGPASTGRKITGVLLFHGDTSNDPTTSGWTCTVGGTSMTGYGFATTGSGTGAAAGSGIFLGTPSGTSGNIVIAGVNWTGVPLSIVVLDIEGYLVTPASSYSRQPSNGGSKTSVIPSNGAAIVLASYGDTGGTTWTNLTERGDESWNGSGNERSWAYDGSMPANGGLTISASPWSGANGTNTQSGVILNPI